MRISMSIVENHEMQPLGHEFGKTEILHLVVAARKLGCKCFPVYSEVNDGPGNLHCKGFTSKFFTRFKTGNRNWVYWCMLCGSDELFINLLHMDSCTFQRYSVPWLQQQPLVYLIITFRQYSVLNLGTYVKGQGMYPLGHCDLLVNGVFSIFFLSTYTQTKRQVRTLLSPPLTSGNV